jgi:hypothetical protein
LKGSVCAMESSEIIACVDDVLRGESWAMTRRVLISWLGLARVIELVKSRVQVRRHG